MADRYYNLVYLVPVFLISTMIFRKQTPPLFRWIKEVRKCFQEDEMKATYVLEESLHQVITQINARPTENKVFLRSTLLN